MKESEINKKITQELIDKYLRGDIKANDLKRLINYYESFQLEKNDELRNLEEDASKNKMLITILESIEKSPKINAVPLYKKTFFKCAVAACFLILLILNLFTDTKNQIVSTEKNYQNIQIGTEKAKLTLADGTSVILQEGKEYHSESANSDGTKLEYSNKNRRKKFSCSISLFKCPQRR